MKRPRFFAVLSLLTLLVLPACMFNSREVTIHHVSASGERDYFRNELVNMDGLSFEAQNFLVGNLLMKDLSSNPRYVLAKLHEQYQISKEPLLMVIAADLCRYLAIDASPDEAIQYHLSCFMYCRDTTQLYWKSKAAGQKEEMIADHSWTILSQSYNEACCGIFRYLKNANLIQSDSVTLQGKDGRKFVLEKPEYRLSVPVESIEDCFLCSSYTVRNLRQTNRRPGLGIPLTARLKTQNLYKSLRTPKGLTIPVTMLIRPSARPDGSIGLQLVFQDTTIAEEFTIKGRTWPLALDFSTPLACFLDTLKERNLLSVMLNPLEYGESTGLYMLEPYQKEKIPVVFTHGLMSSPETWVQMINSLRNNPQIREKYQFWFFCYSSGSPIIFSARKLRDALLAAEKEFCTTPEGKANFNRMVLVGHSMGGMVTRLLLQRDPSFIMENTTGLKREELKAKLTPEDLKIVDNLTLLPALPFVHRAIFMAVPHQGAAMAQMPIARFGASIIRLPADLLSQTANVKRIAKKIGYNRLGKMQMRNGFYTGIDNLDPENDLVLSLGKSPMKTDLTYHSIIGSTAGDNVPGASDGVVPYFSSHLNNAASELIVKSDHSVHRRPAAIREVLRILLLHLKESGAGEKK